MKVLRIGRSNDNNVVVNNPTVSRHHAQIILHDDGRIGIVDLSSKNGTYVNGRRISHEMPLRRGDAVQIGNTRLPWENYFRTAYGPKPPKAPKTNGVLTLILGLFCMLMLVLLAVLLLTNRNRSSHSCVVDGVELDFNMTLSELREENDDATIIKYEVPAANDNDDEVVYIQGSDYYVINNTIAVTLDESERINYFCTYHPSYCTPKGIHTGSTFGEVVKAYPSLQFSMTSYCYNYFAQRYEAAVEAYDEATCTYFMFYYSQFSSIQWESILQVSGGRDASGSFELSYLSAYMMESIFSSVCVSLICRYNCHDDYENPPVEMPSESTAEDVVRRMSLAIIDEDFTTVRALTTDEMYEEIMAEYRSGVRLDYTAKKKARAALKNLPAQTIITGEKTVVVRFKNERGQVDYYVRYDGGWKCFDYAINGVHVPRSMRNY